MKKDNIRITKILTFILILIILFYMSFCVYKNKLNKKTKNIRIIKYAAKKYIKLYENEDTKLKEFTTGNVNEYYISSKELIDKKLLQDNKYIDKNSIIKLTKENNDINVEYINNLDDYITVIYHPNGANISKQIDIIKCNDNNCLNNITLPNITRKDGEVKGWSLNKNDKYSKYSYGDKLIDIIDKKITNKIDLYAITTKDITLKIDNSLIGIDNTYLKCTLYNKEKTCKIKLPNNIDNDNYKLINYNESKNNDKTIYYENDEIKLDGNKTIYTIVSLKDINIKLEELNQTDTNIIIAIDTSNSMLTNNYLENIKNILSDEINNIDINKSKITIIDFNKDSKEILKEENNKNKIISTIKNLTTNNIGDFNNLINKLNTYNYENQKILIITNSYQNSNLDKLEELKSKSSIYVLSLNEENKNLTNSDNNYIYYNSLEDNIDNSNLRKYINNSLDKLEIDELDKQIIQAKIIDGKINLNNINKFDIYIDNKFITNIDKNSIYIEKNINNYYINILKLIKDNKNINYQNIDKLIIKYIKK